MQYNVQSYCQHPLDHQKSKEKKKKSKGVLEKTSISALVTMPKTLTVFHKKTVENY